MKWHWESSVPKVNLMLTLDSDDPELVAQVEQSAQAQGITLRRIDAAQDDWPKPANLPDDYWETAQ